jgi:hypothetical protein
LVNQWLRGVNNYNILIADLEYFAELYSKNLYKSINVQNTVVLKKAGSLL